MIQKEKERQIIKDYLDGLTIKEIFEKNNVSRNSVTNIINRNNIPLREFKTNDDIEKAIINEYVLGNTTIKLSKKYKLHRQY